MNAEGTQADRPFWFFLERYAEAYRLEAEAFVTALAEKSEVPVTGEDAVAALRIGLAATRSLHENRPVRLEEI
jgi:myo-inositol 2-dehydrogenase/D-chiro-inositol 1-dehydrogenase